MQAEVIQNSGAKAGEAAYYVSRLMYEKHIYEALCDNYKDLYYAHRMLAEIENGIRAVLLVRDENIVVGCIHGTWENNGDFVCHIMFKRNVDALQGCLLCEEAMKKFCREQKKPFKRIIGNIWEKNRAAIILGKRYGAKVQKETTSFIWKNGYFLPCKTLIKEIE